MALLRLVLCLLVTSCGSFSNKYDPNCDNCSDDSGTEITAKEKEGSILTTTGGEGSSTKLTPTKYPLSVGSNKFTALTYNASSKTLFALDAAQSRVLKFVLNNDSVSVTESNLSWQGSDNEHVFVKVETGFIKFTTVGNILNYNDSFVQTSSAPLAKSSILDGGGYVDGTDLIYLSGGSNPPKIYKTNLSTLNQTEIAPIQLGTFVTTIADTTQSTAGLAKVGSSYWLLAKQHLMKTDLAGGVKEVASTLGLFDSEETANAITSDGTNIWIITNTNLIKIQVQ